MTSEPLSPSMILRVLVVLVVALAMIAGYYQALYQTEQLKYAQLELEYQKAIGENR